MELPLSDNSSQALAKMVKSVLGGGGITATVVFGSEEQAAAARGAGLEGDMEVMSLAQAVAGDMQAREGAVALVAIPGDQVREARGVAERSGGRPIVGVNVEWEHAGDGGRTYRMLGEDGGPDAAFANSFAVVYSYLPLAIDGLFGAKQEGAVFKCVRGGAPEGSPWRILVKEGNAAEYKQVGAMQRRPEQEDLENALYNAAAASSPVNKGVGFLKGMQNKLKDAVDSAVDSASKKE